MQQSRPPIRSNRQKVSVGSHLDPQQSGSDPAPDTPLPRPQRRRRRAKADRGLPPDSELAKLATEYLQRQHKLWPELLKAGLLPEINDRAIAAMVEDFKHRHRTGQVDLEVVRAYRQVCAKLAGNYDRYSCDNSSPTSIIDQMVHSLDKAHQEERFVPWAYVFCDYSVTGLDRSRQGYSSYKNVLQDKDHGIESTYVDDFTRPSRDEIEWWRLAHLSRRLQKRMIGASDGFDLSVPDWDMKISIYGLLSRLFIKGLREKVKRGMRGAARRGTCLGMLPLGFTRTVQRDAQGTILRNPDGLPKYVPCIDPATRAHRVLLYELFVEQGWSPYRIAKHFNLHQIEGWDGWTERGIKQLLWSASAVGVFIWNRKRREYDWEAEKWIVVPNPRKDWVVYHNPNLALVPIAQWKKARQKLVAQRLKSPLTGRKMSRNQKSATTLFSGTLFCGSCGHELTLMRSTGKYKVMGCINGPTGKHGCTLAATKSTRIIEECLLGYLHEVILNDARIEALVAQANAIVEQQARQPPTDTAALRAEIRRREAKIAKLVVRIEDEPDEAMCVAYHQRVKVLQKEVNDLNLQLREAEASVQNRPTPLSLDRARAYLAEFRKTLGQEVPVAAEAIRTLTGPITIRQEPILGRKRAPLGRHLRPRPGPCAAALVQEEGDPSGVVIGDDTTPPTVEVPVEKIPKYERLAPIFQQLRDNGASIASIAAAHQIAWQYAKEILHFADTGDTPAVANAATDRPRAAHQIYRHRRGGGRAARAEETVLRAHRCAARGRREHRPPR